jgi:hypothetical protein
MDELRFIHAAHALWPGGADDGVRRCEGLDQLSLDVIGRRIRRIGGVSHMAAIASRACARKLEVAPDTETLAVFHGTAMGDVSETSDAFEQATVAGEVQVSPMNFSNAVGTMTLYHSANVNEARGPSVLVTQGDFSFEMALRAALDQSPVPSVGVVLVGGSDGYAGPREAQAVRLAVDMEQELGEGSAWIALNRSPEGAQGQWLDVGVEYGRDRAAGEVLRAVCERVRPRLSEGGPVVLPGLRIDASDLDIVRESLGSEGVTRYLDRTGWYPTASAAGIVSAIEQEIPRIYLHLARDSVGSIAYMLLQT